jgi:integrase/recombinase XerD
MSATTTLPRAGLPFTDWPERDRILWEKAAHPDEFALDPKPLGTWSRRHQGLARYAYGMWLVFLAEHHSASLDESPGRRATQERVRRFVRHALGWLQHRTVAVAIVNLAGVLRSLEPELDCYWMFRFARHLKWKAAATPPSPKSFCHAALLFRIGEDLMGNACDIAGDVTGPVAFRDGLIISLLASVPVRIHAFSCIRIGQHLCRRSGGIWTLHWAADETKGKRQDDWPVPSFIVRNLETYLQQVRPALQARAPKSTPHADHLWIGVSGLPIGDQIIRRIIKRRTAEALGAPVLPHAFRTSAATTFVLDNPEHAIEAAALLAHRDFRITEQHYLAGRRQLSVRVAHQALERVRRASRPGWCGD